MQQLPAKSDFRIAFFVFEALGFVGIVVINYGGTVLKYENLLFLGLTINGLFFGVKKLEKIDFFCRGTRLVMSQF